jgi:regulator of telomere elongation helicase 1
LKVSFFALPIGKLTSMLIEIPSRMKTKFSIDGFDIWLPFEKPYNCQREYVEKVIEALKTGNNAMLESPTGTGKTISFLCASVAFIKATREKEALKS